MCIACREKVEKEELMRVVKTPSKEFKLDFSGKLDGRGAYIHKKSECMNVLVKKRLLNKAFKQEVNKNVYEKLLNSFNNK